MEDLTGKEIGQYRLVEPLGQGGMATVYKAYQPRMDRYVAIKILPRYYAAEPSFVGRFEQEAKVIANLEHPNILPVHDYGESDGYTYLVMRFVEGGTLRDQFKGEPMAPEQITSVISEIGRALDYAHAKGVIHRDVKPSNILVDATGISVLTDFGIAKMVGGSAQFTITGGFVGTPAYASPEQTLGQELDGRSDIYSLGVVLYEMATGRPPFDAETPMAIAMKHIHDPLPPPRSINPELNGGLERIILKALAKDREDRFQSAGKMVEAILEWGETYRLGWRAPGPETPPAKPEAELEPRAPAKATEPDVPHVETMPEPDRPPPEPEPEAPAQLGETIPDADLPVPTPEPAAELPIQEPKAATEVMPARPAAGAAIWERLPVRWIAIGVLGLIGIVAVGALIRPLLQFGPLAQPTDRPSPILTAMAGSEVDLFSEDEPSLVLTAMASSDLDLFSEDAPDAGIDCMGAAPGAEVSVFSQWDGARQDQFNAILQPLIEACGIDLIQESSRELDYLEASLRAGTPWDIVVWPDLGPGRRHTDRLVPLWPNGGIIQNYERYWIELGSVRGEWSALPLRVEVKSLIWFSPSAFETFGYPVPATFEELDELVARMVADGNVPWAMGLEAGEFSGWTGSDFIQDLLLVLQGPEYVLGIIDGSIPYDDPGVGEAYDIYANWARDPAYSAGGIDGTLSIPFIDAMFQPFLDPPEAMMVRQGHFTDIFIRDRFPAFNFGPDYDFFPFPGIRGVQGTVDWLMVFNPSPAAQAVVRYLSSEEGGRNWASVGFDLSPNMHSRGAYELPHQGRTHEILASAPMFTPDLGDAIAGSFQVAEWQAVIRAIEFGVMEEALTLAAAAQEESVQANVLAERPAAIWRDDFQGTLRPEWRWINEDPTHWTLAPIGLLRITLQAGGAAGPDSYNLLVREAPAGDFEMITRIVFTPSENFQIAGLLVHGDAENSLVFGRAFCDRPPPLCVGNGIYFDRLEAGELREQNFATPIDNPDEVFLRINRQGSEYTGLVSENGTDWAVIGTHSIGFEPAGVGFATGDGGLGASEIPADFAFFELVAFE